MSSKVFSLFVLAAIFPSTTFAQTKVADFFAAFTQQMKEGMTLTDGRGECRVKLDNEPEANHLVFSVQTKGAYYGGLHFQYETKSGKNSLELVNQWNWGSTVNIGRDRYRYSGVLSSAMGGDKVAESYVDIDQKSGKVVAFSYRMVRFKANKLASLDLKFGDIIASETKFDCFGR